MFLLDNPFQYKVMVDNWERDLLELGFAKVYSNGKTVIPTEQLKMIINIDETCLFWMEASATEVVDQRLPFIFSQSTQPWTIHK